MGIRFFLLLLNGFFITAIYAQNIQIPRIARIEHSFFRDRILTVHPFLLQPPDVRSAAMGFARYALSPSTQNVFTNPSLLPFVKNTKWGVNLNYMPLSVDRNVSDVFLLSVGGFYKFNYNDVIASAIRYSTFGQLELTNIDYESFGKTRPFTIATDVAYTRRVGLKNTLGFTGRFIASQIIGASARAFSGNVNVINSKSVALDILWTYRTDLKPKKRNQRSGVSNVQLSGGVSNLGVFFGNRYDYNFRPYLPTNLFFGGTYTFYPNPYNQLAFTLELNKLLVPVYKNPSVENLTNDYQQISVFKSWLTSFTDASKGIRGELSEIYYSFGVENWLYEKVAFRGGYYHQNYVMGNKKVLTFGLGIRFLDDFTADIAYGYNIANQYNVAQPFVNILYLGIVYNFFQRNYWGTSPSSKKKSPLPAYY